VSYKRIYSTAAVVLWLAAVVSANPGPVARLVNEAVALGVPLYNAGQAEACAAVYRVALRSMLLLEGKSIDPARVRAALERAGTQEPRQAAWTLRYALDDVYALSLGGEAMRQEDFLIDFSTVEGEWYSVNDNVMGGVSAGGYRRTEAETGVFSGRLSLRNNGGFASVRTRVESGALDGYEGLEIRLRGDGRRYRLLAGGAGSQGTWQSEFATTGEWQTVRVPFASMPLSIRGWQPASYPPAAGRRIDSLGFIIGDKDERPFRLEVDWIRGYGGERAAAPATAGMRRGGK